MSEDNEAKNPPRNPASTRLGRKVSQCPPPPKEVNTGRSWSNFEFPSQRRGGEDAKPPELPRKFQDAFAAARTKAEIKYANCGPVAGFLSRIILIQDVFFAYCDAAVNACRDGELTPSQVHEFTGAAWPAIFNSYFAREYPTASESATAKNRGLQWRVACDDQRWKRHLAELDAVCEANSAVAPPESEEIVPETGARSRTRTRLKPKPSVLPNFGNVTKKIAAEALGVTVRTVERMSDLQKLNTSKGIRYKAEDLRRILAERGVRQPATK
jgi:hypothetical protein